MNNPATSCGSITHVDNQSVGEAVPVVGAPFDLVYFSDRVYGRADNYTLQVPVLLFNNNIGATVGESLLGRGFSQNFAPGTISGQTTETFFWDGKDANGNL